MLPFLVLMFNIHRKTRAPSHSVSGSVTSGHFRTATGTLTLTSRKMCPRTLSQTHRHLLCGLILCSNQASGHPDLAGKRNTTLGAAKWLQLFFPAGGNGFDQWKSISSCNANTWNLETSCETLWENVITAARDANLNGHFQIHTVWFLKSAMDLHSPSSVSFGMKK